jgi:hypothetical protein
VNPVPKTGKSRLRPRSTVFTDRKKEAKRQAARGLGFTNEVDCPWCLDTGCPDCEETRDDR